MAQPLPSLIDKILHNAVIVRSKTGEDIAVLRCEFHGTADHKNADITFEPKVAGCEQCAAVMFIIKDAVQRERRAAENKPEMDWAALGRAVANASQAVEEGKWDFHAYRRPKITFDEPDPISRVLLTD